MLLIGLTGSIATGKSTVSHMLSRPPYNLPVIDADVLAREVVEPGTKAYNQIVAYFGDSTPDLLLPASTSSSNTQSDVEPPSPPALRQQEPRQQQQRRHHKQQQQQQRPLNRAALGRRVFGDDASRRRDRAALNKIVHPAVRRAMYAAVAREYVRGRHWAVVLDVPLLFEAGLDLFCGAVVVVAVHEPAVQMRRLRARDPDLSERDAEGRVASQMDVREKARRAEQRESGWGWRGLWRSMVRAGGAGGVGGAEGETMEREAEDGEREGAAGAGIVIWNDADKETLQKEVRLAMERLRARSPGWWNTLLWILPPLAALAGIYNVFWSWQAKRRWEREQRRR